jgi:hypothetical protein
MLLLFVGILLATYEEQNKPIMQIKINICKRYKHDPETCELFKKTGINLFDRPGGLEAGAKYVGSIPACDDIVVDVLEIKEVNGIVFYKIKYRDIVGWQTKRLLTGEE